jgi:hypothetical protein
MASNGRLCLQLDGLYFFAVKTKIVHSSEKSANFCQSTLSHIPEDNHLFTFVLVSIYESQNTPRVMLVLGTIQHDQTARNSTGQKNLLLLSLSRHPTRFKELECSRPCSQKPATGSHPEAARYVNWSRGAHDQQICPSLPFAARRARDILSQAGRRLKTCCAWF